MEPKDKAKQLIGLFKDKVNPYVGSEMLSNIHDDEAILYQSKRCALICIEEIENYRKIIEHEFDEDLYHAYGVEEYWEQVKVEILEFKLKTNYGIDREVK